MVNMSIQQNAISGENLDTVGNQEDKRYVKLTNDLLFYMVFSMNEEARKDLVSCLLGIPASEIEGVKLLNPIQYNNSIDTKQTIMDLKIHLKNSTFIFVEIQVNRFRFFTRKFP